MNSQMLGLRVASVVFGLVSLAQLGRLVTGADVSLAGHVFPLWPSGVAFVVAGGLCLWMWRLSRAGHA